MNTPRPDIASLPEKPWTGFSACSQRLSPAFHESLAARQATKEAGLGVTAGGGAGQDIDGLKAIARAVTAYLLAQPERVQASIDKLEDARAINFNGAVDITSFIADGQAEAVTSVPWTGMFFYKGQHFLVDSQRLYSLDSLAFHGVISPLDIAWFRGLEAALSTVMVHAREYQDLLANS